jgi:hypothetical protein
MALQPITRHPEPRPVEEVEIDNASVVPRTPVKRYLITLRIRHPSLDPEEVSAALHRQPAVSWKAGDQCVTPKGTRLSGVRTDGLWSLTFRYKGEKSISRNLEQILDDLTSHKDLFGKLDQLGAARALYLQLPGNANNGDRISPEVLRKLADLRLALELEVFPEMT